MNIMANRMDREYLRHQNEYEEKALSVLRSGRYVLGKEVKYFEAEFAKYVGAKYCAGLASGLDALWLSFRILEISSGDEVIVAANTYIASVMGITINGATPIFVEPDEYYNIDASRIEEKITDRTKAVLVVHLYGQPCRMDEIKYICEKYGLLLVEDCAQSHGASYRGKMTGTFGNIGCFSFYPSKNLGAFGDGGAIVTDDSEIYRKFLMYRNYGSEKRYYNQVVGANSRLDELQAGLLRIKLEHFDEVLEEKKQLAESYNKNITNKRVLKPEALAGSIPVWHQYVVRCKERDRLIKYLNENGIQTLIHYPIPPHLSEAYQYLGYKTGSFPITEQYANEVLSIPLYIGMRKEEQDYVIEKINQFKG